jgi:biotin carboxyl carrier protein
MNISFWLGQKEFRLNLEEKEKGIIQVSFDQKKFDVTVEFLSAKELLLNMDGKIFNIIIDSNSLSHSVFVNGKLFKIEKKSALKILREERGKLRKRDVKTSMPGKIVSVLVREGDEVKEGQSVLILEAMKMQNEIKAPQSGRITRINFNPQEYVEAGAVLFSVE